MTSQSRARRGIGDAWLFPSPVLTAPLGREVFGKWFERIQERAGLPAERGRGWHTLRRKCGTELMHQPVRVVQALGGWATPAVLMTCYQAPQTDDQRRALSERKPLRAIG
jgi:integrase